MALDLEKLRVSKGDRTILSDLDLHLSPGSVTAVLGANGAGKSELVLAMAGMLPITAGRMMLDGQDLTGKGPDAIRAAGIAAVPEGHRVLTKLSVDDNLRAAGSLLRDGLDQTLDDTYALFPELAERKGQLAGTMSGGQQQMLALGHAMMCRPRYLLIDEMSLGLAPLVVKRLMRFVTDLKDRGVGILLIEQFTDMALSISENAFVLRGGIIRYSGRAENLLSDPALLDRAYFGLEAAERGAKLEAH
ncbi:ABC transporter ATP-binding protein [Pseudoprimorskyibacter insulae]|uniref:High-affinity branched-chain amino acid transport ATP-binding protein LivF n=1 Tax=Pseudoprimorskyibacter insulae TaxID=1695997 RepID=A0A2R8AU44_9RHOB|nr:ABC transporter ATP-binding protein [Pseudoprimorskyibacter insulae]SPF79500.1 High-affinity branched-chain amino acid transport ATP-binding protein LivF [Pseudoprimorskyibacter insulae]